MKKIKLILTLTLLFLVLGCGSAMAADWTIEVNGQPIDAEVKIIEGRSLIPLRAVGEALGLEVTYYQSTKEIWLDYVEQTEGVAYVTLDWDRQSNIYLYNADITAYDENAKYALDVNDFKMYVQPVNIDGRVYVPVRLICDSFGAPVKVTGNTISIGKIFTDTEYSVKKINKLIYSENNTLYIPNEANGSTSNDGKTPSNDDKANYKTISDTAVSFLVDDYNEIVIFTDGMYSAGKELSIEQVDEIYDKSIKAVKRTLKDPVTATFNNSISTTTCAIITDAVDYPESVYTGITGECTMLGKVRATNSYGAFITSMYYVVYDKNWNILDTYVSSR